MQCSLVLVVHFGRDNVEEPMKKMSSPARPLLSRNQRAVVAVACAVIGLYFAVEFGKSIGKVISLNIH